jgi:hypothetical protein
MKKWSAILAALVTGSLILSSCGGSQSSSSTNLVCAFIEGYSMNKSLALTSLAQGGSAASDIEVTIGGISNQVQQGSEVRQLFEEFLSAMSSWGSQVDSAYSVGDQDGITTAALELETKIDLLAIKCETLGWKFEQDWR